MFGSKEVVRKAAMETAMKRRNTFDGRVLHLLEEEMEGWEETMMGMHNHFSSFTNYYNLSLSCTNISYTNRDYLPLLAFFRICRVLKQD